MLGDIVPNKPTNGNAQQGASTPPPTPPQDDDNAGGYGTSSFGEAGEPEFTQPQPQSETPREPEQPEQSNEAGSIAVPAISAPRSGRGRAPLVLTIVGVLVFIGGVVGLFVYAMSGM